MVNQMKRKLFHNVPERIAALRRATSVLTFFAVLIGLLMSVYAIFQLWGINRQLVAQVEQNQKGIEYLIKTVQRQHDRQDVEQECLFNLFIDYVNTKKPISEADRANCRVVEHREQQLEPKPQPPAEFKQDQARDQDEVQDEVQNPNRQSVAPTENVNPIVRVVQNILNAITNSFDRAISWIG